MRKIRGWRKIADRLCSVPFKSPGGSPTIPVDERAAEVRAIKAG
jgi:5'-nucleotidase